MKTKLVFVGVIGAMFASAQASAAVQIASKQYVDKVKDIVVGENGDAGLQKDVADLQKSLEDLGVSSGDGVTSGTIDGEKIKDGSVGSTQLAQEIVEKLNKIDEKQNHNLGAGEANKVVVTDASGNIIAAEQIASDKVDGLGKLATMADVQCPNGNDNGICVLSWDGSQFVWTNVTNPIGD